MGEESRGTPELLGLGEGLQVRLWHHPWVPGIRLSVWRHASSLSHFSESPPQLLRQGILLYLKLPDPLHWLALEFSGLAYSLPA